MKRKKKIKVSDILAYMFYVVCTIICMWFVVSFIDVNMHNQPYTDNYGNYWKYNVFNLNR